MIAEGRLIKIAAVILSLGIPLAPLVAKPEHRARGTDVNELRKSFLQTFGQDFDLLGDEVREKSGGKYWLLLVRAKRIGTFVFRHKFEQTHSYRYQDSECRIIVGEKGCSRMLHTFGTPLFCVGDSVIIPIVIGDNIIDHSFSRVSRFPDYYDSTFGRPLDDRKVDNPAQNNLKYMGREVWVAVHRSYKEASVDFVAVFEASETGRFNLNLSPHIPGRMQHYPGETPQNFIASIIIVPKDAPVTGLVASVSLHGTDEKSENPRASSSGGASYPASVFMLRPGDRIDITYGRTVIPNNKETQGLLKEVEPTIKLLPMSIDPGSYYNDWLIDHVLR